MLKKVFGRSNSGKTPEKDLGKIENQKSLGVIYEMFRKQEYRPIGPRPEDSANEQVKNNSVEVFLRQKSLDDLKAVLWEQIGPTVRAKAWRYLFRYIPLNSPNEEQMLTKKRLEYAEYTEMNTEEKFAQNNDGEILETIKLIRKDIHRTLPTSAIFRNPTVQDALCRVLLIYSVRWTNQAPFKRLYAGHERHPRPDLRRVLGRPVRNELRRTRGQLYQARVPPRVVRPPRSPLTRRRPTLFSASPFSFPK